MKNPAIIIENETWRNVAINAVKRAPLGHEVEIRPATRTKKQNKRWWAMLQALAKSTLTFDGVTRDVGEWHDIILHGYLTMKGRETGTTHRGLHGGILVMGRLSSTRLTKAQFSEMSDMTVAFIDEHNVYWPDRTPPPNPDDYR